MLMLSLTSGKSVVILHLLPNRAHMLLTIKPHYIHYQGYINNHDSAIVHIAVLNEISLIFR